MTTLIPEENGAFAAAASNRKPKAKKKARVAPRRARVGATEAKSHRKAKVTKKAPKGRPQPQVTKSGVARAGSKTSQMLELLNRPTNRLPIPRIESPAPPHVAGQETSSPWSTFITHGERKGKFKP